PEAWGPAPRRPARRTMRAADASWPSPQPDFPSDGGGQLFRIVAYALSEHGVDLAHVGNRRRGITGDDRQIRLFADGDRADLLIAPEVRRAVEGADPDGLERRETRFHQQ